MSSLKKDIQDILGCTCAFNEQYDSKSYNLKTEEYEDCECVEKIPQIINLIESVIKESMIEELGKLEHNKRFFHKGIHVVAVSSIEERLAELKGKHIKSKLIGEG